MAKMEVDLVLLNEISASPSGGGGSCCNQADGGVSRRVPFPSLGTRYWLGIDMA